jgi:hypothetical protein
MLRSGANRLYLVGLGIKTRFRRVRGNALGGVIGTEGWLRIGEWEVRGEMQSKTAERGKFSGAVRETIAYGT